jgi:hypothetical protein
MLLATISGGTALDKAAAQQPDPTPAPATVKSVPPDAIGVKKERVYFRFFDVANLSDGIGYTTAPLDDKPELSLTICFREPLTKTFARAKLVRDEGGCDADRGVVGPYVWEFPGTIKGVTATTVKVEIPNLANPLLFTRNALDPAAGTIKFGDPVIVYSAASLAANTDDIKTMLRAYSVDSGAKPKEGEFYIRAPNG